ncbi:MAG: hypothetical protein ABR501_02035, partial [Pyrinomonadaceae bacterium]
MSKTSQNTEAARPPSPVSRQNGPSSDGSLRRFVARLVHRENLTRVEASQFLEHLLDADATDAQIAAGLVALTIKGETVDELVGLALGMRTRAVRLKTSHARFLDTAGTGSS